MGKGARTEYFLELYKRLEASAEPYIKGARRGSVVFALSNLPRFSAVKGDLDYCREVRNLLMHEEKIDGEFAVEPSEKMTELLKNLIHHLENPEKAFDHATKIDNVLSASPDERILPLMTKMRLHSYSHVPILENGRVAGVFSENTVFQALLDRRSGSIDEETTLKDFSEYLPVNCHLGHCFKFVSSDILYEDAREIFDSEYDRKRKLRVLFLTETGRSDDRLVALLTPYDVLERITLKR